MGDTYVVCEKCTRRFAVGNVPTNVCGDCDENQRLRNALPALLDELEAAREALRLIDNNRAGEQEDAHVLYRKVVNSANIARQALSAHAEVGKE